ncbi:hypothetical protein [Bradyrhizobium retamae]|uniref:Uncharacterized protein n=1 Tax=Bradyrhizobium retamae TaxID=1300035 RepID=A0A0R3MPZ0_9BRAD|nr:hypothetical protein [Bradyrhizobium retamae]KRR22151.1 hypothetical protein CQ13_29930 [Bradyrhizobium retamae]
MTKTAKATTAPATPVVATVKLLVGEKAIKAALVSIHRRGQTLQQDIHQAACSVLDHVAKHSDIRLVTELLVACPDMTRKNALKDWFVAFGPVMIDGDEVTFVKGKACDVKGAMLEPFWMFSPEPVYVPVDVAALLDKIIKKLAKDEKETGATGKHTALMHSLAKLKPATV